MKYLNKIYEFKVTFKDFTNVKTYRIIRVNEYTSILEFGSAILLSFNGGGHHLFWFWYNNKYYVIDEDEDISGDNVFSAFDYNVGDLPEKCHYEYDFGDSWQFEVKLRKVILEEKPLSYPTVIKGAGLGFIEDIGSYYGLDEEYQKKPKKFEKFNLNSNNRIIKKRLKEVMEFFYFEYKNE